MAELHERWQADLGSIAEGSGLSLPSMTPDSRGRQSHSDAFRWLWGEFTSVRRLDPVATW
jgi:hypothetical protein